MVGYLRTFLWLQEINKITILEIVLLINLKHFLWAFKKSFWKSLAIQQCELWRIILLNIYLSQLTNVRKWLPILVCLLTLTIMDQIIVDYHFISISDKIECEKMYINGLVQRWMVKDLFFVETNYNDEILQKSLYVI